MKTEKFQEKLIKRFYGITGPLDEYKRQEIYKIGNTCFIWSFVIIVFANLPVYLLAQKYPEFIALAYPIFVLFILFLVFFITINRSNFNSVTAIDVEELNETEQKQLKHVGLKSGLIFGIFMWLFSPFGSGQPYWSELLRPKGIIITFIAGCFFGIAMHVMVKARINKK